MRLVITCSTPVPMIPSVRSAFAIFTLRHLAGITFKGGQLYTDKCQGWEGSERP